MVKILPAIAGDTGLSPAPGRFHMPGAGGGGLEGPIQPLSHNYRACRLQPVSHDD